MNKIFITLGFVALLLASSVSATAWWNTTWNTAVPVTINTSASASNYALLVNVTVATDMAADCSDVRFVSADNTTLYYAYNQTVVSGNYCLIWVNFTSISTTNGTQAWMYYNATGQTFPNNPTKVFQAFEDFRGEASYNTSNWAGTGCVATSGALKIGGTSNGYRICYWSTYLAAQGTETTFYGYRTPTSLGGTTAGIGNGTYGGGIDQGAVTFANTWDQKSGATYYILAMTHNGTYTPTSVGGNVALNHTFVASWLPNATTNFYVDNSLANTRIFSVAAGKYVSPISFSHYDANKYIYVYWAYSRNILNTEPTYFLGAPQGQPAVGSSCDCPASGDWYVGGCTLATCTASPTGSNMVVNGTATIPNGVTITGFHPVFNYSTSILKVAGVFK